MSKATVTKNGSPERLRIDKWLWAARFFKTRSLAKDAIQGGKVHCAGQRVKVAREVVVGDLLEIRQGSDEREVRVIALSDQRRGAAEAALLYEETSASVTARKDASERRKAGLAGFQPGDHRPSKKERRQINRLQERLKP